MRLQATGGDIEAPGWNGDPVWAEYGQPAVA